MTRTVRDRLMMALALIAAALLAATSILATARTAAAQEEGQSAEPQQVAAQTYMGYAYVSKSRFATLHVNESAQGYTPSVDNLAYCFNADLPYPPTHASSNEWVRQYNTTLGRFATAPANGGNIDTQVLNVMWSGYSSNPNRAKNMATLGLHSEA